MNGKKGLIAVLITVLLAVTPPLAATANKGVLLDELYEKAQLQQRLGWIRSSMMLDNSEYGLPTEVLDAFNGVVNVRYGVNYFRSSMINTLNEALTMDELLQLVEWYNSSLGKKILKLENTANNPAYAASIDVYINERLSKQLPRSSRTELIEELMTTLDVIEHGTELAATASVGVRRLLKEIMPLMKGSHAPLESLKEKEKPEIRREMQARMKGILFYAYRTLSDQEIRQYLDFSRSTAMQNFQRGQVQAMARVL
ncbi:MAG: DUF2059 domain-containing protein [Endozoicomonas sp. (ex Botrylloides leachii)]|nr:DUF2059 domain-containing protein [Endozoicomonas sp. (ex Botrylloides leachii)]